MATKKQYILSKKGKLSTIKGKDYQKGAILSEQQYSELSKRQKGFCEEFDAKNKTHLKLAPGHVSFAEPPAPSAEEKADKEEQKKTGSESAGEKAHDEAEKDSGGEKTKKPSKKKS